jgi:hypothetical protein
MCCITTEGAAFNLFMSSSVIYYENFYFLTFSSRTCSKVFSLWYFLLNSNVCKLLAHPSSSNRRGIMLLFYYIQLYHRHEVGLGVVDVLFLAADKPFFSIVTKYPSSLVLAD